MQEYLRTFVSHITYPTSLVRVSFFNTAYHMIYTLYNTLIFLYLSCQIYCRGSISDNDSCPAVFHLKYCLAVFQPKYCQLGSKLQNLDFDTD